jgi:hypothetical protein
MMKTLLISATALALSAPVLAQTPAAPPEGNQPSAADAEFAKADADKDGALTIAEAKMADASVTQADFDKYDADKSKSLSKSEFSKWAMSKKGDEASSPGE